MKITIKSNSYNDNNNINIQKNFQQKNITKIISKSKKENNLIDNKTNIISFTLYKKIYNI